MQQCQVMGDGDTAWVKFSVLEILVDLQTRFGSLSDLAQEYWTSVVDAALQQKRYVSSCSGTNYTSNATFTDRRRLAISLYYDAVVTSRNALGRAAVRTRKYHVISFRIANIGAIARDSDCILPLTIVPPRAWDAIGFNGVVEELLPEFRRLYEGAICICNVVYFLLPI